MALAAQTMWAGRNAYDQDAQPLRHRVRVPFGPGAIERDGVLLTGGAQIRFADLSEYRAVSGGEDGARAELVVRVHGGAGRPTAIDRINFVDDAPLHLLRRRLLRQFATVGTQDAHTRMNVERSGIGGRYVEIKPYGWELHRDAAQGICTVRNSEGLSIGDDIDLVAVSVTQPGTDAQPLVKCTPTAWTLPGLETPDTWLVVGGGSSRGWFRHMLWNSGLAAAQQNELSGLATIRDFDARQTSFAEAMQSIVDRNGAEAAKELQHLLDAIQLAR